MANKATATDSKGRTLAVVTGSDSVRSQIKKPDPVKLSERVEAEQDGLLDRVQERADKAQEKVGMHISLGQDIVRAKFQHRESGDFEQREQTKKDALVAGVRLLEIISSAIADLQASGKDALAELKEMGWEPADIKQLMQERRVAQLDLDLAHDTQKKKMAGMHAILDAAKMYRPGNAEVDARGSRVDYDA